MYVWYGYGRGKDPEKTNINVRLTEALLADIDATWREEGYISRDEILGSDE